MKMKGLEDKLVNQVNNKEFKKEWEKIEQLIIKLNEKKSSNETVIEVRNDLMFKLKNVEQSIEKIDAEYEEKISKINLKFDKIDQKIDTKANNDTIFELKEKINKMCERQELKDIENKVFPMLTDVIKKIAK